jgi:hypothetical protein
VAGACCGTAELLGLLLLQLGVVVDLVLLRQVSPRLVFVLFISAVVAYEPFGGSDLLRSAVVARGALGI